MTLSLIGLQLTQLLFILQLTQLLFILQLTQLVDRILSFPVTSPVIKFLTGLELLLEKAQVRSLETICQFIQSLLYY